MVKPAKKKRIGKKRATNRRSPVTLQTSPGHKGRFEQLLDNAVIGVKKK